VNMGVVSIGGRHTLAVQYKIEETSLDVHVHFPMDYPLGPAKAEVVRNVGVKRQRLAYLLLRVQALLSEFCRVCEALAFWKVALDRDVDSAGECTICFFIVDETTNSFPIAQCPSCSNRFHRSCLTQWLHKNSARLCPACRSEIPK
jgi:Ring finger domain